MRKILFLVIFTFSLVFITGCKKVEVTNLWNENSIKIDGNGSDWKNVPLLMADDFNGALASMNDAENQYLILKINNQRIARRIQRMGLTIWFNSNGKKKKDFGIRYTGSELLVRSFRQQRNFEEQMRTSSRFETMREKMRDSLPEPGMLAVIQKGKISMQPETNPWGLSAASAENEGVYCYEFKIPLQFDKSVTDDQTTGVSDKIKVCLEIGGINDEMRDQMKQQMGGTRGSRSGGMRGGRGGMGGGMKGGGMRGSGSRMPGGEGFEKQEVWLDVVLAKKTNQN